MQNSSPSSAPSPDKDTKHGKVDMWKPLNYLVEVANRSKSSSKFTSQGSTVKSEPQNTPKSEGQLRKSKGKDQLKRSKFQDENGRSDDVDAITESAKPKKIRKKRKSNAGSGNLQGLMDVDANNVVREKRISPIWFHLVPSEEQ